MSEAGQYHEFLRDQALERKAGSISRRLLKLFTAFSQDFLQRISVNTLDHQYQRKLVEMFKTLQYSKSINEGPICANLVKKYYRCYDCEKENDLKVKVCICQDCFVLRDHKGHNFRLIERVASQLAACDCGDEDILHSKGFCKMHKGFSSGQKVSFMPSKKDKQSFILEISFMFNIFVTLSRLSNNTMDENKKKAIVGQILLDKVQQFMKKSYTNKIIVGQFLAGRHELTKDESPHKNMLEKIFSLQKYPNFLQHFCEILIPLSSVPQVREIVISYIFQKTSSKDSYLRHGDPIARIAFQYLSAGTIVYKLIERGKLPCLEIKAQIFSSVYDKCEAFLALYQNYIYILKSKAGEAIMNYLLLSINISSLFNYTTPRQEKQSRSSFLALDKEYLSFLMALLKKINQYLGKNQILKKMIKESYCYIVTRKASISLSGPRTFALSLLCYLSFSNERIYDLQMRDIMDLFGENDEEALIANLREMVNKYLFLLKVDNFTEYKKQIFKESQPTGESKLTICTDFIYLRQLLILLIKVDQPFYGLPLDPIKIFIESRGKQLKQLEQMYDLDETSKMQELMVFLLYEINLLISTFIFAGESSICEVIVSDYFGASQKKDIFEIYKLIVYLNPDLTPLQFKKYAEKHLKNGTLIEQFVKQQLAVYKQTIKNGEMPENKFNISYNSFILKPADSKQINNLYYLKLKRRRTTELSRLLFSCGTIQMILNIFEWFFGMYCRKFKENQFKNTISVLVTVFETLIILYLQTLDQKVKLQIDHHLSNALLGLNADPYAKQIIEIYTTNDEKIRNEAAISLLRERALQRSHSLRTKKMEKIKQLKLTQNQVLNRINSMPHAQPLSRQQNSSNSDSIVQECIVCKGDSRMSPLHFMCRYQSSNLMSTDLLGVDYPILILSTCGHAVHIHCFRQNQRTNLEGDFIMDCLLCKGRSHIFLPVEPKLMKALAEWYLPIIQKTEHQFNRYEKVSREWIIKEYLKTNIQGRLLVSMVYQLYGYTLYFQKFFRKQIYPVFRVLCGILERLELGSQVFLYVKNYFSKHHAQNHALLFIQRALQECVSTKSDLAMLTEMRLKELKESSKPSDKKVKNVCEHIQLLSEVIYGCYFNRKEFRLEQLLKDKQQLPAMMFKLPADLVQLNREVGVCPGCCRHTSKMLICLLCSLKECEECSGSNSKHAQMHLGGTVFIKVQRGQFCYQWRRFIFLSKQQLYFNYIGEPIANYVTFPEKGCYMLNKDKRDAMIDDLIYGRLAEMVINQVEVSQCSVQ